MRTLALPFAVLALAACDNSRSSDSEAGEAVATATAAPTASATETTMPSAMPPAQTRPAANIIPAPIQGRWGLVPADCTSTRGDAKGLLTIDGTTLKFYESVATLDEIEEAGETRIRADFDFTGEGMSWQRDVTLDVQDGGKTLIRREYGEDAAPGPFRYTKCV